MYALPTPVSRYRHLRRMLFTDMHLSCVASLITGIRCVISATGPVRLDDFNVVERSFSKTLIIAKYCFNLHVQLSPHNASRHGNQCFTKYFTALCLTRVSDENATVYEFRCLTLVYLSL